MMLERLSAMYLRCVMKQFKDCVKKRLPMNDLSEVVVFLVAKDPGNITPSTEKIKIVPLNLHRVKYILFSITLAKELS